jgi:hypothetical protein
MSAFIFLTTGIVVYRTVGVGLRTTKKTAEFFLEGTSSAQLDYFTDPKYVRVLRILGLWAFSERVIDGRWRGEGDDIRMAFQFQSGPDTTLRRY